MWLSGHFIQAGAGERHIPHLLGIKGIGMGNSLYLDNLVFGLGFLERFVSLVWFFFLAFPYLHTNLWCVVFVFSGRLDKEA